MDVFRKQYRQLNPDEIQALNDVKSKADELYTLLAELKFRAFEGGEQHPDGTATPAAVRDFTVTADARCMALAKTKLEESVMWATKAITG